MSFSRLNKTNLNTYNKPIDSDITIILTSKALRSLYGKYTYKRPIQLIKNVNKAYNDSRSKFLDCNIQHIKEK